MSARDAILSRLRMARTGAPMDRSDAPATRQAMTLEQKIALFRAKMELVHAEVHEVSRSEWGERLLQLAKEKGVDNLLYADDMEPASEIEHAWAPAADQPGVPKLVSVAVLAKHWKSALFNQIDAAFTTTRAAIAASGSLVLWPDQREPRLMSLAPPIHFALLEARRLYPSFEQLLATEQWSESGMPANALLISGPSKTADIESTLVYGVHGPRQLVVLLVC